MASPPPRFQPSFDPFAAEAAAAAASPCRLSPLPSQLPSDPFAAVAASPSPSPPPPPPPLPSQPPSNTYSDPYPPYQYSDPFAAASPFFDPLAQSTSNADLYSLLPIHHNYQNPDNYQFCTAGNHSLSLENINHPFSPNDFVSTQNYQLYSVSIQSFQSLLSGNYEPNNDVLSQENHQPYTANNILSHENSGNTSISPESNDGNSSLSLPHQQQHQQQQKQQATLFDWRAILPVGMKFRPTDDELITHYLMLYIINGSSPPDCPVTPLDIYKYEPRQLLGLGQDHGDGKSYFITPAKKIGKSKTGRDIESRKGSFWKPTQAAKPIFATEDETYKVGEKIPLAFYQNNRKTQWLMHELKLPKNDEQPSSKHHVEYVVAVVYYHRRSGKNHVGEQDH